MPAVVYALFPDEAAASAASAALQKDRRRGDTASVQLHSRAPLDGNILPEGATEFGRNLAIAMVAGGVFMAIAGAIAGALDLLLGMTVGMGIALGGVTGVLMGLVGAAQAGTRIPRRELRELEPRLAQGRTLLVVELDSLDEAKRALERLEPLEPLELDVCGGL